MKKSISIVLSIMLCLSLFSSCSQKGEVSNNSDTTLSENVLDESSGTININIDELQKDQVVCIGQVELDGDYTLSYAISAESGNGIMVGVNEKTNIEIDNGELWSLYNSSKDQKVNGTHSSSPLTGTYYIYIGATDTNLESISGTITYSQK